MPFLFAPLYCLLSDLIGVFFRTYALTCWSQKVTPAHSFFLKFLLSSHNSLICNNSTICLSIIVFFCLMKQYILYLMSLILTYSLEMCTECVTWVCSFSAATCILPKQTCWQFIQSAFVLTSGNNDWNISVFVNLTKSSALLCRENSIFICRCILPGQLMWWIFPAFISCSSLANRPWTKSTGFSAGAPNKTTECFFISFLHLSISDLKSWSSFEINQNSFIVSSF